MVNAFEFMTIGKIYFQPGSIKRLGEEVRTLGGRKVLLVTDQGVRNSGVLTKAIDSLEKEGFSLAAPDLFARIAEALGRDIRGLTVEEASRQAAEAVREILVDTRIPTRLREVGAKKEAFEAMAKDGVASGIHLSNPRRVTLEDAVALYQAAY